MNQDSESDDFLDSDYEEVRLLYVAYKSYCKSRGSRLPKQFRIDLIEKIISENRDEFSAPLGRPSISPSTLRLTPGHFPDVIPLTEKNQIQRYSVLCATVKQIPEVSQQEDRPDTSVQNTRYPFMLFLVSKTIIQRSIVNFFPFALNNSG
ncbi:piggyBac transposable element-derived protein 4 [Trichonephila clavipes]|nr:piggyBac transposable element-derived protein 4 [Trichonephila clavipes]